MVLFNKLKENIMSKFTVGQSVFVSDASRSCVAGQIVTIYRISGSEVKVISESTSKVGYVQAKYLELIKPKSEEFTRQEFVPVVVNGKNIDAPEVHTYTLINHGSKNTIKAGDIVIVTTKEYFDDKGQLLIPSKHTLLTLMYDIGGVVWANIVFQGKFAVVMAKDLRLAPYRSISEV
ncbi:hypothetical protein YenMTG1_018 [Yersinia phage vB_YenM_TG1]|uniref:Uncharacterized protein n=1 Tax=Yersinia phage vB_YenM_TG1 TaxID=1589265 RepID=A0A0B4ZWZ5_9CAUD|nr:MotB-like transcriptional regulator [Yersinia phage vB_YenM_TG1]AJD81827.1 hypothetical protein YenMTG1_018 [Yersinia phage vB_YenM_TG1]